MSNIFKAGLKLRSAVSDAQIMILRIPATPLDLRIGGVPVLLPDEQADGTAIDAAFADPILTGKRYTDAEETMEFLCTKGGDGLVTADGVVLGIKQAKQLPSSD